HRFRSASPPHKIGESSTIPASEPKLQRRRPSLPGSAASVQPGEDLPRYLLLLCRTEFRRHKSKYHFPEIAVAPIVRCLRAVIPPAERNGRVQVCGTRTG